MKLRIPNFLKRVDLFLLTHYPNIWATRVHYFVFYSLICGNLLMILLGYLYPLSITNISDYNNIVLIADLLRLSGFLVIIYWLYLQIRDAKPIFSLKQIVSTSVIYVLCLSSIVINSLVFGIVVRYRVAQLIDVEKVSKDYVYLETQKKLIKDLIAIKEDDYYYYTPDSVLYKSAFNYDYYSLTDSILRNSELNADGYVNRYRDVLNELNMVFPLRIDYYYKPDTNYVDVLLLLGDTSKIGYKVMKGIENELRELKVQLDELGIDELGIDELGIDLFLTSIVFTNDKVFKYLEKYKIKNHSIRELYNKMVTSISLSNSTYFLASTKYRNTYDYNIRNFIEYHEYPHINPTFGIPEDEHEVLGSLMFLIYSISTFTILLRSYKRKTIWIAFFCVIGLFIVYTIVILNPSALLDRDLESIATQSVFAVICLPFLIRAYFCKRNSRFTNIILLIPIVYIFLFYFILGVNGFFDYRYGIVIWNIGFLPISLIFGLVYFYSLIRINKLPT